LYIEFIFERGQNKKLLKHSSLIVFVLKFKSILNVNIEKI